MNLEYHGRLIIATRQKPHGYRQMLTIAELSIFERQRLPPASLRDAINLLYTAILLYSPSCGWKENVQCSVLYSWLR